MNEIVESSLMVKGSQHKTIITVGSGMWDSYYSEFKKLNSLGFKSLIKTKVSVLEEVYSELNKGVFVIEGDISAKDYVSQNTKYEWVEERMKSGVESIGEGKLPGSLGFFRLKRCH